MPRILLIAVLFALTGCAAQPARVSGTRWPQAVVNIPKAEIHDHLIGTLAARGATVESDTPSIIQARLPAENPTALKVLLGCGACDDPYVHFTAVLSEVSNGTQVVFEYWLEVPQPNGSERRVEMTNNDEFNGMQQMLWTLRDHAAAANRDVSRHTMTGCAGSTTFRDGKVICNGN